MRLKSLQIQGYKSFANKMHLQFDDGLTAVVGPNGSGKSNVVDAIRWVLGEQSYSSLRGRKTEDMIFAGSDGRARLSMAVVTIQLDNSEKWLPLDFSEVTISRRAYRSGENEYYLNGSRVRLKDVHELLAQGGMSRQTYTVIGQGTIDQILALHSGDRRRLFEEAAGITFHRQKREETLKHLEETKGNLVRLNDLVQEIEPRVKRLARQAGRASEYQGVIEELANHLTIWYGYSWHEAKRHQAAAEINRQTCEQAFQLQQKQLTEVETALAGLRTTHQGVRQQLGEQYAESGHLNEKAQAVQRELAVTQERTRQFTAQQQEIKHDLELLTTNLASQQEQLQADEVLLQQITAELHQAEERLHQHQGQFDEYQLQQRGLWEHRADLEQQQQRLHTHLTTLQAQQSQLLERQGRLEQEQRDYALEIERLEEQKQALIIQQNALMTQLAAIEKHGATLAQQKEQYEHQLAALQAQAEKVQADMRPLSRQYDGLRARQEALERLRTDMEGYHEGVRAILNPHSRLVGVLGTVSQIIEVPPTLEVAIETVLGGRLQDVVMERFVDAQQAIDYLKQKRLGRATLLPLDTIRIPSALTLPQNKGVIGVASDLVQAPSHLRAVVEFTLNRAVVVEDLPTARQTFAVMQGGFTIVTREGELMRSSGTVTGGQSKQGRNQGTFLAREREWRELPQELATLQQQADALHETLVEVQAKAKEMAEAISAVEGEQREQGQLKLQLQGKLDQVSRTAEQLGRSMGWQADLQHKGQAELAQLAERKQLGDAEIASLEEAAGQLTTQREALAVELERLAAHDVVEAVNQAKTDVATIRQRQQQQQQTLGNHQRISQQLREQIQAKQHREQSLITQQGVLQAQQDDLQTQYTMLAEQLGGRNEALQSAEQELASLESRISQQMGLEKGLRQQWQRLETELRQAALSAARGQDELTNLARQVEDDLGLLQLEVASFSAVERGGETSEDETDDSVIDPENLPQIRDIPPGLAAEIKTLRNKLRRLGSINADAPREYAELNDRYEFLVSQMTDLETAAHNLREVITKLDALMHDTFAETFQKVSTEFKKYFKALFGGGEADILLTEPDDLTNTGVDIVARPPGKRLQSMALLSGGERSLTAQALIFSLLSISPTPFVIFDEVDAMLDEANVGRFRDALVGLSATIQFIVVTHNRRTIEAANTIYGVSMGADSVSQIYSLRLDEWEEQFGGHVKS